MPKVLICHAELLDSDKSGHLGNPDGPDHPLVFWNQECVPVLLQKLHDSNVSFQHLHHPTLSVDQVMATLRVSDDIAGLVVFGHGTRPPGNRIVWNRRKHPSEGLASEQIFHTEYRSAHFFLACYSFAHFHEPARAAKVPIFVGFEGRMATPAILSRSFGLLPKTERDDLVTVYRQLLVELPHSAIISLLRDRNTTSIRPSDWNGLAERYRQQLADAASRYRQRYYDTGKPVYVPIAQGFVETAASLKCMAQ
jgi:hypothetical protein